MDLRLNLATLDNQADVLDLVRQYHEFDAVPFEESVTGRALLPLLKQEDAGRVWLIRIGDSIIGYVALCFGYSIEFGGRDAFIDEMYILDGHRGGGIGRKVLEEIRLQAKNLGVMALHLEVDRSNERARRLYRSVGFTSRERYHLMSLIL
jgi:ribosomal protein S18 acetylase RimI-like enzyme